MMTVYVEEAGSLHAFRGYLRERGKACEEPNEPVQAHTAKTRNYRTPFDVPKID